MFGNIVKKFIQNESGATSIEYAVIALMIAMVIIVAVTAVSTNLQATFTKVADHL